MASRQNWRSFRSAKQLHDIYLKNNSNPIVASFSSWQSAASMRNNLYKYIKAWNAEQNDSLLEVDLDSDNEISIDFNDEPKLLNAISVQLNPPTRPPNECRTHLTIGPYPTLLTSILDVKDANSGKLLLSEGATSSTDLPDT